MAVKKTIENIEKRICVDRCLRRLFDLFEFDLGKFHLGRVDCITTILMKLFHNVSIYFDFIDM